MEINMPPAENGAILADTAKAGEKFRSHLIKLYFLT